VIVFLCFSLVPSNHDLEFGSAFLAVFPLLILSFSSSELITKKIKH
jgi:hypothetical protein